MKRSRRVREHLIFQCSPYPCLSTLRFLYDFRHIPFIKLYLDNHSFLFNKKRTHRVSMRSRLFYYVDYFLTLCFNASYPAQIKSTLEILWAFKNSSISSAYSRARLVPHTLFLAFRSSLCFSSYLRRFSRIGVLAFLSINPPLKVSLWKV